MMSDQTYDTGDVLQCVSDMRSKSSYKYI